MPNLDSAQAVEKYVSFYPECQKEVMADDHYSQLTLKNSSRFAHASVEEGNRVVALEFNTRGTYLAYSREDGSLNLWKVKSDRAQTYSVVREVHGIGRKISSISWHPVTHFLLATVGGTSQVNIWDASTGVLIKSFETSTETTNLKCCYDASGRWLGVLSSTNEFYMFDADQNYNLASVSELGSECAESGDQVTALCWSPDSKHLYAGRRSGKLGVFAVRNPGLEEQLQVSGHTSAIYCLRIDPQSRFLIAGGDDAVCSVWDASNMCCETVISDFDTPIIDMDLSRDALALALCSETQTRVYSVSSGACIFQLDQKNRVDDQKFRFYPEKMSFVTIAENECVVKYYVPKITEPPLQKEWAEADKRKRPARKVSSLGNLGAARRDDEPPRRGRFSKRPLRR
ncbi:Tex1p [Lachancea thermotolerans CBS 6340]|uniref:KLTH0F02948p n=1 Tax=Lachancea thermotolerans (strain ATCC 56472 / CBS 6340 / NRRL Y-8284) TaxID=559295 RepID=C5DKA1_LACTC|nr:KLTH0F02948p [Lachancea thermotolerans CBS 6340]CAR23902.1 KLTH0F02948p [Lachancea thermotolerans CBS 6340]